jgi:DNA-binding transcriptional ArsR family regulator
LRDLETVLKAAADPTRMRILMILEGRELCVCQIQAVVGLAASTVSKHLSLLKAADLVEDRREGRWIHYRHSNGRRNPHAAAAIELVRASLAGNPRIREDRARLKAVLAVNRAALCRTPPGLPKRGRSGTRRRASTRKPIHA